MPFVAHVPDAVLTPDSWEEGQVLAGAPVQSTAVLWDSPEGAVRGVWEVTPGAFSWVFPADEMFTVLSGRVTVEHEGTALEIGPGDMAVFAAGDRTVWTVHETLRKTFHIGAA
ncbi:putative cupin superfamily protein [Streptacidiphilus sp. MAP12-20]|uniref:cupin domain-containing protein n=1 Tax=Streptacidiphilus sp. MAP12-20 TaxID=3156299 RepID=UPI00351158DF